MTLSAGERIGPYEVRERLGLGGMGEVYRARDVKLERDIAVKILPAEYARDPDHLRRFEHEARAASALNHPNIITIYEIDVDAPLGYIAMELVEGENLREVSSRRDLSLKHALRIACKIADGLAAAHERGIVHRDLKPENVMISREGFVKILDFGLAKLANPLVSSTDVTIEATSPGLIIGTVAYMSPEQASARRTDFRSDQFSFGSLLYELFTGKHPFQRPSGAETLAAILREEPPPLGAVDPALPAELNRIVLRCLARSPEDRYASTRDLARDLREVRDSLTRPGNSSPHVHSGPQPPVASLRSRRSLIAGGLATLAAIVALLAITVRTRGPEPATPAPVASPAVARTLAVAHFRNVDGGEETSALVDGLGALVSSRLAGSGLLRVVAPAEDAELTATSTDALAKNRGADVVLRADVRRTGERFRVGYRLVDISNGAQLAAETFTGTAGDLFTLEERMAESVMRAMSLHAKPRQRDPQLSGGDQQTLVEAMGLLTRAGDPAALDGAIARLEKLLTNARDSSLINCLLGQAYLNSYKFSRKAALLEQAGLYAGRAVTLDPSSPDAHVGAGELALTLGKNEEAEASFRKALELRHDHPGALLGLGDAYDALGRAAEAERHYEKVLSLVPGWPGAYGRYGRFCFSRGKYDKAVEVFGTLTRLAPQSPRPFTNLGAAYHALGRYDDAVRSYQRAIALRPTPSSWSNLGTSQYALGRFDEAADSYDQALQLAPENYLLWANAGDAFRWSSARKARAAAAYQRAIELAARDLEINPSDALVHAVVASSLAKLGKKDEARKSIEAALRANPTDSTVLYHAAVTSLLRDDHDSAILWLSRAIEAGYMVADVEREPEFRPLRNRNDFKQLLQPRRSS